MVNTPTASMSSCPGLPWPENTGYDPGTVEDAQLQPVIPGVRLLPRPGMAQNLDFPLVMTGEIDGTIYLVEEGKSRAIGNALVELVNESGDVVGSTRSSSDGFYVMPSIGGRDCVVRATLARGEKTERTRCCKGAQKKCSADKLRSSEEEMLILLPVRPARGR